MDKETLDKVGDLLKNATPDDILKMAQAMADKHPEFLVGIPDKKERAKALIQLELNNPDHDKGYIKGLVDGLWFGEFITDDERNTYYNQLDEDMT